VQEHISVKTIERYRKHRLSAEELLGLDDHLAECKVCRLQIGGTPEPHSSSSDLLATLATEEFDHPAYEQLAAYLDGQMGDVEGEIFESHLTCCRPCEKELQDLQAIRAEIASRLSLPATSEVVTEPIHTKRATLLERLAPFWRLPSFRIPLQVTAAAACVALIVWAVTLPLRKDIAELKSQLAQAEQRNEELQRDFEISKEDAESLQTQITQLQSADQNPQPETIAIALNDGKLKVDAQGNIAGLDALPSPDQQIVKNAIASGQVKIPQSISSLTGKAGVLMGGAKEGVAFALISPVGTAVSSTRPMFRWQALAGATGYRVTVLDLDFNPISKSPVLASASWTTAESLERGRTYVWVVTAIKDGKEVKSPVPPAPEARFKVLEKEMADEVLKTRRDNRDSHLLSGLVYAQAGLLDEAEREFQLLVRANPKSAVARKLLRSVKSLRGR
jgi:hypothetical protein